jgi:hypothetical protein
MEGHEPFLQKLGEAIEKRRAYLDAQRLPQMREAFRSYQTFFEGLLNLLIRKGLIREDPYKYDQKITEITVPPDDALTETEKTDEMSYRLSAFRNQLDYMNTSYQFSTDFLDLPRLKRISSLIGYISWRSHPDTGKGVTSRTLAQYVEKIRSGTDSMAAGILKDTLLQLDKASRHIATIISELVSFERESYKCALRGTVLHHAARAAAGRHDEAIKSIKRAFAQANPGQTFYPELVEEILEEDSGQSGAEKQQALLSNLAVVEEQRENVVRKDIPHREVLMEAVRILSRTGIDLAGALETVAGNRQILFERRLTLGERIRRWLAERVGRREEDRPIEIEYFEGAALVPKTEQVYFLPFEEAVKKKASMYASLLSRASAAFQKLETVGEDQLLDFVSKQIMELQVMHRRLGGLNAFFQSEAPRELRPNLKGIKLNLSAMLNGIVKANQRKHDYVAIREEEEQMKRLGIG